MKLFYRTITGIGVCMARYKSLRLSSISANILISIEQLFVAYDGVVEVYFKLQVSDKFLYYIRVSAKLMPSSVQMIIGYLQVMFICDQINITSV